MSLAQRMLLIRDRRRGGAWARRGAACMLSAAAWMMASGSVMGAAVKGIEPAVSEVVATEGGVIVIPLRAARGGTGWPSDISATIGEDVVRGMVVMVERESQAVEDARWTSDARGMKVRVMGAEEDSGGVDGSGVGPALAMDVPAGARGDVRVLGVVVRVHYFEDGPVIGGGATGARTWGADTPDAESPFEFWRWQLVRGDATWEGGIIEGETAGRGADAEARRLIAEHSASLWRAGLGRVRRADAMTAERCRGLLTSRSLVGHDEVATWVMDPAETGALLRAMLNPRVSDAHAAADAERWAEAQRRVVAWVDHVLPGRAVVNIAHRGEGSSIVTLRWDEEGAEELTRAVEVDGRVGLQVTMVMPGELEELGEARDEDRRRGMSEARERAAREGHALGHVLEISSGSGERAERMRIAVAADAGEVRVPGVFVGPFAREMRLADVEQGLVRSVSTDRRTTANVRRVNGRWEVFFECMRPGVAGEEGARELSLQGSGIANAEAAADQEGEGRWGVTQVRGKEAVMLAVGFESERDAKHVLVVEERGWQQVVRGEQDGSMQVYRRSYGDRWLCRVVLPMDWVLGGEVEVGFARGHGDGEEVEVMPMGWTHGSVEEIGRVGFDLRRWEE